MNSSFRDLLKGKGPIIFDGAMGTSLQSAGLPVGTPPEKWNLTHPQKVRDIHTSYVETGADVIETNTFGANRVKLEKYKLAGMIKKINGEGVKIARQASSSSCLVGASVGPLGVLIEPWGDFSQDKALLAFKEQIEALCLEKIDLIIIETMMDLNEARLAAVAARSISDLPVVCQVTFSAGGKTLMGNDPRSVVQTLSELRIEAVGANCSLGPRELFPLAKEMVSLSHLPVIVQPNAGQPRLEEGKTVYSLSAKEFSEWAEKFVDIGVKIVGGCCGTTPSHTRATVGRLKEKFLAHERG